MFDLGFDFGSTTSVLSYVDEETNVLHTINIDSGLPYIPSKISHNLTKFGPPIKYGYSARGDIGSANAIVYDAFKTLLNNEIGEEIVRSRGYDKDNTPEKISKEFIDTVLKRVMEDQGIGQIDNLCIGVPENWGKSVRTVKSSNTLRQSKGTKRIMRIISELEYVKKFEVVFEPEAASAFFVHNYNAKMKNTNGEPLNGKLLIIDYGGGSLDITLSCVKTKNSGEMEISLIDSEGIGENHKGMIGSAGIRYMESVIACAVKEAGIPERILQDVSYRRSFEEVRKTLETNLRDKRDELGQIFSPGHLTNPDYKKSLDGAFFCERLSLNNGDKEEYKFNIFYGHLYRMYNEVVSPELDGIIDVILKRNSIDPNNNDLKIGIVGGFSNFCLVRNQIWKKFRIANAKDPHISGLLTNPEDQEKAISLGAALIASKRITLCITSEFAIGVYTSDNINNEMIPVPHFAIKYRQKIDYGKIYYSKMLDGKHNQLIGSPTGTIDRLIILRDKDERHIMVLQPNEEHGKKLKKVIGHKAQVGFSISEDNVITVHIREVEDLGLGNFREISMKEIELSDFDSLFTNYTVPIGEEYPFRRWIELRNSLKEKKDGF